MSEAEKLRERLEQIVARAKTKRPGAANYECLLSDLQDALAAEATASEPPAHFMPETGLNQIATNLPATASEIVDQPAVTAPGSGICGVQPASNRLQAAPAAAERRKE